MPTYTYTSNTPNAADPMNVTQPLILENFQAIPELIAINHVGFNVNNFGKHNVIALQEQSAPVTTTTEIDLFCQATGSPNPAELFIIYPQGATTKTPVKVSIPYSDTATGTAYTGYVQFPSGIKISYGQFTQSQSFPTGYISVPQYTNVAYPVNSTAVTVNSGWPTAINVGAGGPAGGCAYTKGSPSSTTYNYLLMGI